MPSKRPDDISPLIQKWHPDATPEEQRAYTEELRAYLAVLYRVFERWEREGIPEVDSPESGSSATL